MVLAAVLIWLSVSLLLSVPILLMGQPEPELVLMVFAWMALMIPVVLVYCGVIAGAVWTVVRVGRLLHILD
jgi:hypothetical protein